jgi:hypothetical protein
MKTVKSLLLGTAAGFVAFTGAQAADLPLAEPVEYVKICDTYGKGYFYIPGTDTCLKLSGYVRVSANINFADDVTTFAQDDGFVGAPIDDEFRYRTRASVRWDARSETEWGTLRSFIELRGNAGFGGGNSDFDIEQGFVQFAGITAGRAQSFFDYIPYDSFEDFFDDNKINTIAYTASFGSGFAATIGIEDKSTGDRSTLYDEGAIDQVWPNIVAALRVDQAWGSAQVSAAVQDNAGDEDLAFQPEDDIGWAVQAGVSFNLPTANEGSFISAQGAYSEGAIRYAGAGNIPYGTDGGGSGFGSFTDLAHFDDQSLNEEIGNDFTGVNNTFWQVGGAIGFQATETVNLQVVGTYFEYENAQDDDFSFTGFKVEGKAVWTPVDNLDLGLALQYISLDGTTSDIDEDPAVAGIDGTVDDLRIETRIQRNF